MIPKTFPNSQIFDSTNKCFEAFDNFIGYENGQYCEFARQLRGRLALWDKYAGARAKSGYRLDDRLDGFDAIVDAIVSLLNVIVDNMEYALSKFTHEENAADPARNEVSFTHAEPGEMLGQESIKKIFKQIGSKPWGELVVAISELLSLTRTVRESSISNRDSPVPSHYQRQDSAFFEHTCRVLTRARFPDARSTLTDQLGKSIMVRRNRLLYRRDHEEKMQQREEKSLIASEPGVHIAQPANELSLLPPLEEHQAPPGQEASDRYQQPPTLLSVPRQSLALRPRRELKTAGSVFGRSSRLEGDVGTLYPDKPTPDSHDKFHGSCPYCFVPQSLPMSDEQWRAHVDKDLQIYICLSEQCADPIKFFDNSDTWLSHMNQDHGSGWPQNIHLGLWCCDLEHADIVESIEFPNVVEFETHLQEVHELEARKIEMYKRRKRRRGETRGRTVCPLCEKQPVVTNSYTYTQSDTRLLEHIAGHLRALAMLSLPGLDKDPEDLENSVATSIDMESNQSGGRSAEPEVGSIMDDDHSDAQKSIDDVNNEQKRDEETHGPDDLTTQLLPSLMDMKSLRFLGTPDKAISHLRQVSGELHGSQTERHLYLQESDADKESMIAEGLLLQKQIIEVISCLQAVVNAPEQRSTLLFRVYELLFTMRSLLDSIERKGRAGSDNAPRGMKFFTSSRGPFETCVLTLHRLSEKAKEGRKKVKGKYVLEWTYEPKQAYNEIRAVTHTCESVRKWLDLDDKDWMAEFVTKTLDPNTSTFFTPTTNETGETQQLQSQPDHSEPLTSFERHISAVLEKHTGFNGWGDKVPYIPRVALDQYFNDDAKFSQVLFALFYPSASRIDAEQRRLTHLAAEQIRATHLVVFCILLHINRGAYIQDIELRSEVRDDHLPLQLNKLSLSRGSYAGHDLRFWRTFEASQFMFTPAAMVKDGSRWPEGMILPYSTMEKINSGRYFDMFRVSLPDYAIPSLQVSVASVLNQSANGDPRFYALKRFRGPHSLADHDTECKVYRHFLRLYRRRSPGMVTFCCGYQHGNGGYVLLEYADKGSLSAFMANNEPPDDGVHILQLYTEFLEVLKALQFIHNLQSSEAAGVKPIHQNIHPDSILVLSKREPSEPGEHQGSRGSSVRFKLADLGLSANPPLDGEARFDRSSQDARACTIYGAPETLVERETAGEGRSDIDSSADIFSFGCVLLVFCTWIVRGFDGVFEFEAQRSRENAKRGDETPRFFNNESEQNPNLLDAIERQIDLLRRIARRSDFVTAEIVTMVSQFTLKYKPYEREYVGILREHVDDLLKNAERKLARYRRDLSRSVDVAPSDNIEGGDSRVTSTALRIEQPKAKREAPAYIEMADVLAWKRACKSLSGKLKRPPLHGEYLLKMLGKRDVIFLLDNSSTMSHHWSEVINTLEGLSYLAKNSDENGMRVYFSNYDDLMFQDKKGSTEGLIKVARNALRRGGSGVLRFESRLHGIMNSIEERVNDAGSVTSVKEFLPISVYVFTDGLFENVPTFGTLYDLQERIMRLLPKLRSHYLGRRDVSIQFIQFGNDPVGTRRLQELDELGAKPHSDGPDIIDTEHHTGNVWKMLLGAMDQTFDDS